MCRFMLFVCALLMSAGTIITSPLAQPLTPERERALKPKDSFKECGQCPEVIVVPAGSFTMGSPASEPERYDNEGPQHQVTFERQFAVGKFPITIRRMGGLPGRWRL